MNNITATDAMAKAIIAEARTEAAMVLIRATVALSKVSPEFSQAKNTMFHALSELVDILNKAEAEAEGF